MGREHRGFGGPMSSYDTGPDSWATADGGYSDRQLPETPLERNVMPSYKTVYGHGAYLTKEEVGAGRTFHITHVEIVKFDEGDKLVALDGNGQAVVLNKTNSELLEQIFGSDDFDKWRGSVELFNDQTVRYGTNRGGIRVRLPQGQPGAPTAVQHTIQQATQPIPEKNPMFPPPETQQQPQSVPMSNQLPSRLFLNYQDDISDIRRAGKIEMIPRIMETLNQELANNNLSSAEFGELVKQAGAVLTSPGSV